MPIVKYILDKNNSNQDFISFGGGKAKNMAAMTKLGLPVPEWFCLSTKAYTDFISCNLLEKIFDVALPDKELSQNVEKGILNCRLLPEVLQEIEAALKSLKLDQVLVAVRSSGLDEDSAEHSFAGQFSSYLNQTGMEQIEKSILACWSSAYSERAIAYRRQKGLPLINLAVGVVIQKMVQAEVSGVVFSRNAINPMDRDHLLISSAYGLCEGIVSGEIDTDEILVNRLDFSHTEKINNKAFQIIRDANKHLQKVAVPKEKQDVLSLRDDQVKVVAKLALTLEEKFLAAQDAEWAIENNQCYLVQTRPITTLPPDTCFKENIIGDDYILWDNSNIIESYSGVTSPLTFSFASYAYEQVYIQFHQVVGVPAPIIAQFQSMYRNMLGLIRGQIYYNLINWYKLVLLLPGADSNKGFMETMMGVRDGSNPKVQKLFDDLKHMPKYSKIKKFYLNLITLYRFMNINSIVNNFTQHFNTIYLAAKKRNFKNESLNQQVTYYLYLKESVLTEWKAPIINDYLCMIFFGLLKKLTETWLKLDATTSNLQNDLLCGQGDLESTEPTKCLMRLAKNIDLGDATFKEYMLHTPIEKLILDTKVMALFVDFLDRFGFRCTNELKLEEQDLHDDPSFAVRAVVSYVRMKTYSIEDMEKREKEIRITSEAILNKQLKGFKKLFYYWILKQARKAVKNRENLRFLRTKIFGIARHLFRGVGHNFHQLKLIDESNDVFYLKVDEIIEYVEGRSLTGNLRDIISVRKKEFDSYRQSLPAPDRLYTFGAAAYFNNFPMLLNETNLIKPVIHANDDPNLLYGTPCCPGKITGKVLVAKIAKDAESLNGQILVTERTDPGWVPLYPSCSALLIERGSLLSHSAVVARELGLPTIVGVSGGLMKKLKNDMRVEVDAGKGEIRILHD